MLNFHNWDLKAFLSNFAFEAAALEAIFDPQNRQNGGFSRRAAGTEIWIYLLKQDPKVELCANF